MSMTADEIDRLALREARAYLDMVTTTEKWNAGDRATRNLLNPLMKRYIDDFKIAREVLRAAMAERAQNASAVA